MARWEHIEWLGLLSKGIDSIKATTVKVQNNNFDYVTYYGYNFEPYYGYKSQNWKFMYSKSITKISPIIKHACA